VTSVLTARIVERAAHANVSLKFDQAHQLATYYELLQRWNLKINLSSLIFDGFPDATLDRLLIEPIVIKGLIGNNDEEWVDLGSGGGSPAIPLKIVCPARTLVMVESRSKKSAFLREAVRTLELRRTSVWTGRIEGLSETRDSWHTELVTVRGVKIGEAVLTAAASILRPGGRLAIFGTGEPPAVGALPFRISDSTTLPASLESSRVRIPRPNAVHWFTRFD
jgi:16S rRNA (guanine527-N7)-methyltransferase